MANGRVLEWDKTGEHYFEAGVDRVALYVVNKTTQEYNGYDGKGGVAWNGVSQISEAPSGADSNDIYADNVKYLSLRGAEEFGCTIEAYTYPDEWAICDGSVEVMPGVKLNQQARRAFGLSYRTQLGNDTEGTDYGYILHLIWNGTASPSDRSYSTISENPDANQFSWEVKCLKTDVTGYKPTSSMQIYSSAFNTEEGKLKLKALEDALWGTADTLPYLPTPNQVIEMLGGVG